MALALVGMPIDKLPLDVIRRILQGGESICAEAGIPVAGGHTIDSVEPIYGLVALGLVHPGRIKRNASARAGDRLVLGKPLGVGILSAALKKNRLDEAGYRRMIDSTTRLNTPGRTLAELDGVHAMTDVTGFGLLGHALEMARGAGLRATLDFSALPLVDGVLELARGDRSADQRRPAGRLRSRGGRRRRSPFQARGFRPGTRDRRFPGRSRRRDRVPVSPRFNNPEFNDPMER